MEQYFPENKKVRPRVRKDEFHSKKAPSNVVWWAVNGRKGPSSPLFKSALSSNDDLIEEMSNSSDESDESENEQNPGN